ncbi:aspartate--tRNA ligase, partial [Morganella morganii]|uniref:GAD domain-containing protein n=1 Tax=Morganella morganii TaxID=582 RepID=UPI0019DB8DE6|nr:aspartate--tRNA ligase [Morganella morganii]
PLELTDIADLVKDSEFSVFADATSDQKGRVVALCVTGGAEMTRKQVDVYGKFVGIYGAKGLAWMKVNDRSAGIEGVQSPVAKFLTAETVKAILERT